MKSEGVFFKNFKGLKKLMIKLIILLLYDFEIRFYFITCSQTTCILSSSTCVFSNYCELQNDLFSF